MATLAPGRILSGSKWDYRISNLVTGDNTHNSTVYRAEILPKSNIAGRTPKWALMKGMLPSDEMKYESLLLERDLHSLPDVAASNSFRSLYEAIGDEGEATGTILALEWLDTTLQEEKYSSDTRTYALITEVIRAVLTSCLILERLGMVNTDIKPANVLVSKNPDLVDARSQGLHAEHITVTAKLGDLGQITESGKHFRVIPFAMRPPEMYLGQACTASAHVWATAAMILVWAKHGVLGLRDVPHPALNDAWSMAKILRLFPNWKLPALEEIENGRVRVAVRVAERVCREEKELLKVRTFEEETMEVKMPEELRSLLRCMLQVEPEKRPSAEAVLESSEYRKFARFARS